MQTEALRKVALIGIGIIIPVAVFCVIIEYSIRNKCEEIYSETSPDGEYILTVLSLGKAEFPFGRAHGIIKLENSEGLVSQTEIDLATDGCPMDKSSFLTTWDSDRVWLRIKTAEQPDELWSLHFDGRTELIYPAEEGIERPKYPDIAIVEDENAEAMLQMDMSEFIGCFNKLYRQEHKDSYLRDSSTWDKLNTYDTELEHEVLIYRFAYDKDKYTQPELLIYMSRDESGIYKIALSFDQHGYKESSFIEYRDLCHATLLAILAEHDKDYVNQLFDALYLEAVDGDTRSGKQRLYCFEHIGIYTQPNAGRINIVLIPLTERIRSRFAECGVELIEGAK